MEEESKGLRTNVYQIRTRYDAENARPSKKAVEQWIVKGTRERVFLASIDRRGILHYNRGRRGVSTRDNSKTGDYTR